MFKKWRTWFTGILIIIFLCAVQGSIYMYIYSSEDTASSL